MELTKVTPDLNMYDQEWPIWTHQEQLPPQNSFLTLRSTRYGNRFFGLRRMHPQRLDSEALIYCFSMCE